MYQVLGSYGEFRVDAGNAHHPFGLPRRRSLNQAENTKAPRGCTGNTCVASLFMVDEKSSAWGEIDLAAQNLTSFFYHEVVGSFGRSIIAMLGCMQCVHFCKWSAKCTHLVYRCCRFRATSDPGVRVSKSVCVCVCVSMQVWDFCNG